MHRVLLTHAVSSVPARPALCTVESLHIEVIQSSAPRAIPAALAVFKDGTTWVNETGVAFIVLIPAAWDGVTHHFLLSWADALNLIIFTTLSAHDVPLSPGAGFVNDRVFCNGKQAGEAQAREDGKTQKHSTIKKQPRPTKVSSFLNERHWRDLFPGQYLQSEETTPRGAQSHSWRYR